MKKLFIVDLIFFLIILLMALGSPPIFAQELDCSQELGLPPGFDCEVFVEKDQYLINHWHLDFDSLGNLFVSSDTGPVVYKIAPDGTIKSSSSIVDPDGIAVDSQDRVFVAGSNKITIVNSFEGGNDIIFANGFINLDAIAINSQDDMVVLDGEHYVLKIYKETGVIEQLYYISGGSIDVEFNANDELFISGGIPEQLIKIDLSGNIDFIIPPSPGTDCLGAMEFARGGSFGTDLFILTPRGIEIIDQNNQRMMFATPMHRLDGIAFSPSGDMYLSEYTTPGRIFRVFPIQQELAVAIINIVPDVLNMKSKGKWITCYIELLEGYHVEDIDISTILLNGFVSAELYPTEISDYDSDGIPDLKVKFDRSNVKDILELSGEVEIKVTGKVAGITLEGKDTIRVISPGN